MKYSTILLTSLALAGASPLKRDTSNTVLQGVLGSDAYWNDYDGGQYNYTLYIGNGSREAGWPSYDNWVSFNQMWIANSRIIARSCDMIYKQPNNNDDEIKNLYDSIKQVAHETRVDHRFILAAVMQETKGCVRAMSSVSADGIHNPGLLQDFKGTHTCNDNGKVQNPCPKDQILGMIRDGVAGTDAGHGFAEDINAQSEFANGEVALAYYRGARLYNSGAIDPSNDLEKGGATHCYASDIANRLTGYTDGPTACTFDGENSH